MNRAYLMAKRALRSSLTQIFKDYEIIVVDDCGNDNTEEVVNLHKKEFSSLAYYKLPENRGLSYARNYGISKAKGKYIVCLDDDNELLPTFLEETIKIFDLYGYVDAVSVGRIIKYKDFEDYAEPKGCFRAIDWGWLIKKEVFDKIQYDEELRANEDMDFGIRFFKQFKCFNLNKPLTLAFDMADPKLSLSFPNERELTGMIYFFLKNAHEYTDPKEKWHLHRLMGRKFYRGGYKQLGLGFFWRGFKLYPNLRSFVHWFILLFGWFVYDKFMTLEEKVASKRRIKKHGFCRNL